MKIRIAFSRNEYVKYLGHLDIMRAFQKMFNRAGIKMVYSEGFNPHQKMSFAMPLGVGVLGKSEYLDAEVADGQNPEEIKDNLNAVSGLGFSIVDIKILSANAKKAMAAVRYASYEICFNNDITLDINPFINAEKVVVIKKSKSGESEADIKPLVHKLESFPGCIKTIVSAGSDNNLKPELLVQTIFNMNGIPFDKNNIIITRCGLLAENFVELIDFETI